MLSNSLKWCAHTLDLIHFVTWDRWHLKVNLRFDCNHVFVKKHSMHKKIHFCSYIYLRLFLHAACGGNLNGTSGLITSPSYPSKYSILTTCEWTISVPENNVILFTFIELNTESSFDVIKVSHFFLSFNTLRDDLESNIKWVMPVNILPIGHGVFVRICKLLIRKLKVFA